MNYLKPTNNTDFMVKNRGPFTLDMGSERPISLGPATLALADLNYYKPRPISFGLSAKKAISEPMAEVKHSLKWARKLKHLKPKQHSEFIKARILSWEDFECSKKLPREKQLVSALVDLLQKENTFVQSGFKVYSRIKNKRVLAKEVLPIQDADFLGKFLLGSDSNLEGDSHLRSRPDDTSLSFSSDSEETYLSDKITEKDLDLHLDGMTRLFDDCDSTREFFQPALAQENEVTQILSDPQLNGSLLPIEGKEEVEKLSGCLEKEACSPNESQLKGDRRMEWKNAQALLSQMGIKLIHDTKKTKTEEMIGKVRRKNSIWELQNLKFNVTYEGSSCSRGFTNSK